MDQEYYKNFYGRMIERNHKELFPYREFDCMIFCNLESLMHENFSSLMFENYVASITLSNHTLEQLFKLTLIYYHSFRQDKAISIAAYNKYQGRTLRQNIDASKNLKIIDDTQYHHLCKIVNDILRNGFSHSEFEKVLKDVPFKSQAVMGGMNNKEIIEVELDRRHYIALTQIKMKDFAKENAFEYFKYVWYLTFWFEKIIMDKYEIV